MAFNYSTLVSAVKDTMEDYGTSFSNNVDLFINRASERLYRDVDSYGLVTVTSVTMSAGDPFVATPTGESIIKNITYISSVSSTRTQLIQKTDEYLIEYWPERASTGTPKYYSRITDAQFYLAPTPVSGNMLEITYIKRPATISTANPTNLYTDEMSNAFFYATMSEANKFDKAWNQSQMWDEQYALEVQRINNEVRRQRRDDRRANNNPVGGDNPVVANTN